MIDKLNALEADGEDYLYCWVLNSEGTLTNDTCLIKQGERGIEAEIPFNDMSQEVSKWIAFREEDFSFSYDKVIIPKVIWLKSVRGGKEFTLIESKLVHGSVPLFAERGYITIKPAYVIQGNAGVDYSEINAAKSVFRELVPWTGLGPLHSTYQISKDGKNTLEGYSIGFEEQDPVIIDDDIFVLRFLPLGYMHEQPFPFFEATLHQGVAFETIVDRAEALGQHFSIHRNLMMLLSVLLWGGVAFHSLDVKRDDDLETRGLPADISARFHPVATDRLEGWGSTPKEMISFFFLYEDIGPKGVKEWFQLCEQEQEITGRMYYLAASKNLSIETEFNEHGVLLEAIADSITDAVPDIPNMFYRDKMLSLINYLEDYVSKFPQSFDKEKSAKALAHSYNSLKHTKEERGGKPRSFWIDPVNLFNMAVLSRAIELLWLAKTLGCNQENVNLNIGGLKRLTDAIEYLSGLEI